MRPAPLFNSFYVMKLDLTSFEKAVNRLEQSLISLHSNAIKQDEALILTVQAGVIKAFEFTYELSLKTLKRYLEMTEASPDVDGIKFSELIRICNEKGLLLSDIIAWRQYRNERNITSHAYNEEKAEEILKEIPQFLEEAKFALRKLKERAI